MQPDDITRAVALQRMVAVAATRTNWPSFLTAPPAPQPDEPADAPNADASAAEEATGDDPAA